MCANSDDMQWQNRGKSAVMRTGADRRTVAERTRCTGEAFYRRACVRAKRGWVECVSVR
jgi:hypothetical protein